MILVSININTISAAATIISVWCITVIITKTFYVICSGSVVAKIILPINKSYNIRVGWWISEVCADRVRLKHLYIETTVQKDFSQKSIFGKEITFRK